MVEITACIITKNEEQAIGACVDAAFKLCAQVLVVDSNSTDDTVAVARRHGADVLPFSWNGAYPKKKEWSLSHPSVRHDWVLLLDADEQVTDALASEVAGVLGEPTKAGVAGFEVPLAYYWRGRELRHGHRVYKTCLTDRRRSHYPDVADSDAPGITEVEGHYQPVIDGELLRLEARLIHNDPDPLSSWIDRHNRYSDWESYLAQHPRIREEVRGHRSERGKRFDQMPMKPLLFFVYSFFIRGGFRDGRLGLDYALALSFYYWMIGAKRRESVEVPVAKGPELDA